MERIICFSMRERVVYYKFAIRLVSRAGSTPPSDPLTVGGILTVACSVAWYIPSLLANFHNYIYIYIYICRSIYLSIFGFSYLNFMTFVIISSQISFRELYFWQFLRSRKRLFSVSYMWWSASQSCVPQLKYIKVTAKILL